MVLRSADFRHHPWSFVYVFVGPCTPSSNVKPHRAGLGHHSKETDVAQATYDEKNGGHPQLIWRPTNAPIASSRTDDIWFLDPQCGWAVNSNGQIVHTEDGFA